MPSLCINAAYNGCPVILPYKNGENFFGGAHESVSPLNIQYFSYDPLSPREIVPILIAEKIDYLLENRDIAAKVGQANKKFASHNNCFDEIVRNVVELVRTKPKTLRVITSFVVTKINYKEAEGFKTLWQELEVPTRIYYANNRVGVLDSGKLFYNRDRNCTVPFSEANILYNGDVVLCRPDWDKSNIC